MFADCHEYVRLYNKELCRFPDSSSYDEIKIESKNTGKLISPVYHRSIRSISHLIEKNILYYRLQAQEIGLSRRRLSVVRVVFEPLTVFVKYYFMKRHFTGGSIRFYRRLDNCCHSNVQVVDADLFGRESRTPCSAEASDAAVTIPGMTAVHRSSKGVQLRGCPAPLCSFRPRSACRWLAFAAIATLEGRFVWVNGPRRIAPA